MTHWLAQKGTLFPSEEPAFFASVNVTNQYLAHFDVRRLYTAQELRTATTGKKFRTTAVELAIAGGVSVDAALASTRADTVGAPRNDSDEMLTAEALEYWVERECNEVTAYLGSVLRPDPGVLDPLHRLRRVYKLAAVSSSALMRLEACFSATGLADLIPPAVRFSAEDSLPVPTSKPNPAIYRFAVAALGCRPEQSIAIEDSVPGVMAAVAADVATIGNVMFVPLGERDRRTDDLAAAGACAVTDSWHDIATLLTPVTAMQPMNTRDLRV